MIKYLKKRFLTFGILIITGLLVSCLGGSPASAPAPVAEIPSAIGVPESVSIDTGELAPAGGGVGAIVFGVAKLIKSVVIDIGGEFYEAIIFGFQINQATNNVVAAVLDQISLLQFPTNPITTTFEADNAFFGAPVKIDFSDYDYDGDGNTEGCTGCTCPVGCVDACPSEAPIADLRPVCYRIWSDYNRPAGDFAPFMAGVMNILPVRDDPNTPEIETNAGVGTFRISYIRVPGNTPEDPTSTTNVGSDYDHKNFDKPLDQTTQYFYYPFEKNATMPPDATISNLLVSQVAIGDDVADAAKLLKTVQQSVNQPVGDNTDSNFQYIARYRTDFDFWSGTLLNFLLYPFGQAFVPPPNVDNFVAACAQLTTAIGVDQNTCIDLGIDVTNVPFLELLFPDSPEVNLPADFPPVPPF